jgi:DNA-binding transcriptional LysR family regulator
LGVVGEIYQDESILYVPLCRDNIVLVVKPDHAWTTREAIGLEEIIDEAFLCRAAGSGTDSSVRKALEGAGIDNLKLNVLARLGSNESIKQAAIQGMGICFVSEMSIKQELLHKELCKIQIRDFLISRVFYLATRRGRELSPAAYSFSKHIFQWIQLSHY